MPRSLPPPCRSPLLARCQVHSQRRPQRTGRARCMAMGLEWGWAEGAEITPALILDVHCLVPGSVYTATPHCVNAARIRSLHQCPGGATAKLVSGCMCSGLTGSGEVLAACARGIAVFESLGSALLCCVLKVQSTQSLSRAHVTPFPEAFPTPRAPPPFPSMINMQLFMCGTPPGSSSCETTDYDANAPVLTPGARSGCGCKQPEARTCLPMYFTLLQASRGLATGRAGEPQPRSHSFCCHAAQRLVPRQAGRLASHTSGLPCGGKAVR